MQSPEVLKGVASTSKWPRNEAKFLALSRPQPRKTRIKSLVLKLAEKKVEIPGIPHLVIEKAKGKGKIPRLFSSSRPRPWKNSTKGLVLDLVLVR